MSTDERATARARIIRVAQELGTLRERVVFIGGTVLPLLVEVERFFESPRPTKDVDAVAGTARYTQMADIEQQLRRAGFRSLRGPHLGRYTSPSGETFDLSFAGAHSGGTGSDVDAAGIATAVRDDGPPDFRHLSPAGLFLMKAAAFWDRGAERPHESKDLADLAVLLVACAQLVPEIEATPPDVQALAVTAGVRLRGAADLDGALRTHFTDRRAIPPETPDSLARSAATALDRIVALG